MSVKTNATTERQVEWIPNGWDRGSLKVAIIRDGKVTRLDRIDDYFASADCSGAIDFFYAIKQAIADTLIS